jgi:hypothetical protein
LQDYQSKEKDMKIWLNIWNKLQKQDKSCPMMKGIFLVLHIKIL